MSISTRNVIISQCAFFVDDAGRDSEATIGFVCFEIIITYLNLQLAL